MAAAMAAARVAAVEASSPRSSCSSPRLGGMTPQSTPRVGCRITPRGTPRSTPRGTPRSLRSIAGTPRSRHLDSFGLSFDSSEYSFRARQRLDARTKLSLISNKRLMEVAHISYLQAAIVIACSDRICHDGVVCVQEESDLDSRLLAELEPHTRVYVCDTMELDDGTKRSLVLREDGTKPLGWLTSETSEGIPLLYVYARPFYEVARKPLKVRTHFEQTSRISRNMLPVGTRLHVTEVRRTNEGAMRVCVVVIGQEEEAGWITAKMPDGRRTLREVKGLDHSEKGASVGSADSQYAGMSDAALDKAADEFLLRRDSFVPLATLQGSVTDLVRAGSELDAAATHLGISVVVDGGRPLPAVLGDILHEKQLTATEIMREWSGQKGGHHKQRISKTEFRRRCFELLEGHGASRALLDADEARVLNTLFPKLDCDGSGELDAEELHGALERMERERVAVDARAERARTRARIFRQKGEKVDRQRASVERWHKAVTEREEARKALNRLEPVRRQLDVGLDEHGHSFVTDVHGHKPGLEAALSKLQGDQVAAMQVMRECNIQMIEMTKTMKVQLLQFQKDRQQDIVEEQVEQERIAREAEDAAAIELDEKWKKEGKVAENRAAEKERIRAKSLNGMGSSATQRQSPSTPPPVVKTPGFLSTQQAQRAPANPPHSAATATADSAARNADSSRAAEGGKAEGMVKAVEPAFNLPPIPQLSKKSSQVAVEQAADALLMKKHKFMSAAQIEADAASRLAQAVEGEKQLNSAKPIDVQLGEKFFQRKIKVAELIREWDPNGDGSITKMEFRQDVRKLLDKPDVRDIDALFEKLDADNSGSLETDELQLALRKLQEQAKGSASSAEATATGAIALRKRAQQIKEVAAITARAEEAVLKLQEVRTFSVSQRIGLTMLKKNLKVTDFAQARLNRCVKPGPNLLCSIMHCL